MKRKVVKLGPSTLVVSLPTTWIKSNKVEAGQEVEVEDLGRILQVQTDSKKVIEKTEIDISKLPTLTKRYLVAKYIKGCDEIKVNISSLQQARSIQKRTDELIGMDILDQKKNFLILKEMGELSEESYDTVIKRVMHLLQTMSDELCEALKNKETDLEYLADIENRINKFTDYCYRLLNKKGYKEHEKTPVIYCITYLLESLSDEYERLIEIIIKNKIKFDSDLLSLYEEVNEFHKEFNRFFFNPSVEIAVNLGRDMDKLRKKLDDELSKTKKVKEAIVLKNLENIIRLIMDIVCELLIYY